MPYCGSRSCHHCFPPGAEERAVLDEADEAIGNLMYHADFSPEYFGSHDDQEQPWFQALAAAYRAGIDLARKEVQEIRRRFDR